MAKKKKNKSVARIKKTGKAKNKQDTKQKFSSALNLPNTVTLIRLVLLPFILFFIAAKQSYVALALFLVASLMDRLDGYLAQKLKKETQFGRGFDAAVDATTMLLVFVFLAIFGYIPWSYVIALVLLGLVTFSIQAYSVMKTRQALHTTLARIAALSIYVFIIAAILQLFVFWFFLIAVILSVARCVQYGIMFAEMRKKCC